MQGLTEFLPISSTAHLRIVPAFAGWEDPGAAFTAVIQLGTMAAVLLYFREDLIADRARLAALAARPRGCVATLDARLGWYIVLGTIPIGIFGLAFKDQIENGARDLYLIGIALIVLGLVLLAAERVGTQGRARSRTSTSATASSIGLRAGAGADPGRVALGRDDLGRAVPAASTAPSAARFSFLLSVPAVVLSGLFELASIVDGSERPARRGWARWRSRRCSRSWSATRRSRSCCATCRTTRRSCSSSTAWRSASLVLVLVGVRRDPLVRIPFAVVQTAWKFGLIALVALVLVVLPGGGNALDVLLTALTIAFFAAIALLVARLYRQYRLDIESLDSNIRLALYGSLAIAVLTFTGHRPPVQLGRRRRARLVRAAGAGVLRPVLGLDALPPLRVALSVTRPARCPVRRLGGTVGARAPGPRPESGQASVEAVAIVPAGAARRGGRVAARPDGPHAVAVRERGPGSGAG